MIKLEEVLEYSNIFINKIITYCKINKYQIPKDKMTFMIKLLGQDYCNTNTLFILQSIFSKNYQILNNLLIESEEIIKLLKRSEERLNNLDLIFNKKSNKIKLIKK